MKNFSTSDEKHAIFIIEMRTSDRKRDKSMHRKKEIWKGGKNERKNGIHTWINSKNDVNGNNQAWNKEEEPASVCVGLKTIKHGIYRSSV